MNGFPTFGRSIGASVMIFFLTALPFSLYPQEIPSLQAGRASMETSANEDPTDPADGFDEDLSFEPGEKEDPSEAIDPFEPLNRVTFWFNDRFYFLLFKPAARAYRVVPEPARVSVSNFFSNLKAPARFVNCLLQLKIEDAGNELARLVINTTLGIGGLFDPARKWAGVRIKDEDFGQTLGHYGVGPGNYVVVPLLGPSSTRDGFGDLVDILLDPITYSVDNFGEYFAIKTFDGLTAASLDKDTYEAIKRQAIDPYIFMRDAYLQRRKGLIKK
ncbi:MAG: VacJ family lipoprotein [Deltaproteobacteria bacterium]|nr:VacJ family lipoprotein [Deltaproteobacteria bacterium]NIS78046.1 VacJ family lipoprotein [Deltaproteobacteria bacterium]